VAPAGGDGEGCGEGEAGTGVGVGAPLAVAAAAEGVPGGAAVAVGAPPEADAAPEAELLGVALGLPLPVPLGAPLGDAEGERAGRHGAHREKDAAAERGAAVLARARGVGVWRAPARARGGGGVWRARARGARWGRRAARAPPPRGAPRQWAARRGSGKGVAAMPCGAAWRWGRSRRKRCPKRGLREPQHTLQEARNEGLPPHWQCIHSKLQRGGHAPHAAANVKVVRINASVGSRVHGQPLAVSEVVGVDVPHRVRCIHIAGHKH